jgi:hypothetical protein
LRSSEAVTKGKGHPKRLDMKTFSALPFLFVLACSGETLDVGTAHQQPVSANETPTNDPGDVAGVWVLDRLDAALGVPVDGPLPAIEVELSPSGVAYRATCARPAGETATEPCPPESTVSCFAGEVVREGEQLRVDFPAIRNNAPEQGKLVTTTDGRLMIPYIYPSYSAGYFRRIGARGAIGGCAR